MTGFLYEQGNSQAIYDTVGWAVSACYDRPDHLEVMRRRGMLRHFSWLDAAKEYEEVYKKALLRRENWQSFPPHKNRGSWCIIKRFFSRGDKGPYEKIYRSQS